MKTLPVSHKPTETTQLFQDHGHSPHLRRSWCTWESGVTRRSPEVKWDHNPLFANESRQDGNGDVKMVPNDLTCQAASKDMHIDLLGSWRDLDLTWPDLRSNFEIDLSRSNSIFFELARRPHFYESKVEKLPISRKCDVWSPKTGSNIDLGQKTAPPIASTRREQSAVFFSLSSTTISFEAHG